MINFPNGYIIETAKPQDAFLVYGELNNTGFVAKGFRLNVPNLSHSGWGQKNELFLHLQSYLAGWTPADGFNSVINGTPITAGFWINMIPILNVFLIYPLPESSETAFPHNSERRWKITNCGGNI